jgi:predicted DsbA family dithiol-disulfide isomerase
VDAIARIAIISDAICPWCYIGKRQLDRALPILAAEGMQISTMWLPYQLNPDMPVGGQPRAEYRARKFGSAARGKELDARVTQAAAAVGLEFHMDRIQITPNTLAAHRLAWFAYETDTAVQDALMEAMFTAYFVDGRNIEEPQVLADCAASVGMDRATTLAFLAGEEGRETVLSQDEAARRAGLNGVPTFVMNRHILFSGAVPTGEMVEAFRGAWKTLNSAKAA